jgi:hypothetical protein
MNNNNYSELIEKYFENKLSSAERLAFENSLDKDPLLKNEFQLQQDIVDSIQKYRKIEIKSRLNQIEVSLNPTYNISGIAASIAVGSIIALGLYTYYGDVSEESIQKIDLNTYEVLIQTEELNDFAIPGVVTKQDQIFEQSGNVQPEESLATSLKSTATVSDFNKISAEARNQLTTPNILIPENPELNMNPVIEMGDEMASASNSMAMIKGSPSMEIHLQKSENFNFHYQFYQGKLFLYGDFGKSPYQIIELNTNFGKKLFLFYDSTFHTIKNEQVIVAPLEEITDQNLVSELNDMISEKAY